MTFKNQPQNLDEWLAIATSKLSDSAKERIRLEIEAHFAGAIEAHRAGGCSEPEAQALALKELGDAYAAHKEYEKICLLESEDKRLRRILDRGRIITLTVGLSWVLIGIGRIAWLSSKESLAITAFGVIVLVIIIPIVSTILSKRQSTRNALLWTSLSESISGLTTFCLAQFILSKLPGLLFLLLLSLFFVDIFRTILLARKIPKDWSPSLPDHIEHAK